MTVTSASVGSGQYFARCANRAVNSQVFLVTTASGGFQGSGGAIGTGAIPTNNDSYVNLTANLAVSSDTATLESFYVLFVPQVA
jgi:hypothetical protein